MAEVITLPGGFTALLRERDELSNKSAKELRRAAQKVGIIGNKLEELGLKDVREVSDDADEDAKRAANVATVKILANLSDDEADALDLYQRVATVIRLISWDVTNADGTPRDLPKTAEDVDELPLPIYSAITTEAAKISLNESFDKDEGLADPKADTAD